jgi:F-type H+-transporting ATPase subunit b
MKYAFELNRDLFETNILNLRVVLGVVVTVIGDAVRIILDDRRKIIITKLQEADREAQEIIKKLELARNNLSTNKLQAEEIRVQAKQTVEQSTIIRQKQLNEDLKCLQTKLCQSIQVEQQRTVQILSHQVSYLSLQKAIQKIKESLSFQKSIELNEQYVHRSFLQLPYNMFIFVTSYFSNTYGKNSS